MELRFDHKSLNSNVINFPLSYEGQTSKTCQAVCCKKPIYYGVGGQSVQPSTPRTKGGQPMPSRILALTAGP
jgi:hypothetical protein